jgi:hypothetical protein
MGTVVAYVCNHCPLIFEVGEYAHWDLHGDRVKAVCGACGTMHRLETKRGMCRLLAWPAPVRSLPLVERESAWGDGSSYQDNEWPFAESDWQVVAQLPAAPVLGQVACGRCGTVGRLMPREQISVAGCERCPVCSGLLAMAYLDTVN